MADFKAAETDDNRQLISMVYHTDGRVNAIEQQVGALGTQLNRIESMLMDKPAPNYAAWIGLAVTMFFGMVAFMYGIGQYVQLQNEPIRERIAERTEMIDKNREFQSQVHYEMGVMHTNRAWQEKMNELIVRQIEDLSKETWGLQQGRRND